MTFLLERKNRIVQKGLRNVLPVRGRRKGEKK
jgi:hypothetical protein